MFNQNMLEVAIGNSSLRGVQPITGAKTTVMLVTMLQIAHQYFNQSPTFSSFREHILSQTYGMFHTSPT